MAEFETETKDVILQRSLDRVSDDLDKRQGSVVYDLIAPFSIELEQAKIDLDNVLNFGFATLDSPSQYIELRAGELGVYRKAAVEATGQVTFYGTDGVTVPTGTRVSTDETDPIYFVTTAEGTIGATTSGEITVSAEAEEAGASGNVAQGEIALVVGDLSGVTSVTNTQAFDGGADKESDASLLQRYYDRVRKPATSGNANQYEIWAKEVAGVGDAKVYPLWNGAGTVKVVLIDEQKTAAPQSTVDSVDAHIADIRPIGATVTVEGAVETAINVTADITLVDGGSLSEAQSQIESALTAYLKTLAFEDPIVRYSKIASIILDAEDVLDYDNLTVNGGTSNVSIADGNVAVQGTVSLT